MRSCFEIPLPIRRSFHQCRGRLDRSRSGAGLRARGAGPLAGGLHCVGDGPCGCVGRGEQRVKCSTVRLPGGSAAIICGGRRGAKPCSCGRPSTRLCDWKLSPSERTARLGTWKPRRSRTCDVPLCDTCTHSPALDKDLCPEHAAIWKARAATDVEEDLALDLRVYGSCYWKVVDGRKMRIHPLDIRYGRDGVPRDSTNSVADRKDIEKTP